MQSTNQRFSRQWPQAAPRPVHQLPGRPKFHERFSLATVEDAPLWGLAARERPMAMRAQSPAPQPQATRGVNTGKHQACLPQVSKLVTFFQRRHPAPPAAPAVQAPPPQPLVNKPLPPLPQEAVAHPSIPEAPTTAPCAFVRQERMTRADGARRREERLARANPTVLQGPQHDLDHRPGGEADDYYRDHPLARPAPIRLPHPHAVQTSSIWIAAPLSWEGKRPRTPESPMPFTIGHQHCPPLLCARTPGYDADYDVSIPSSPPRLPSLDFTDSSTSYIGNSHPDSPVTHSVPFVPAADRCFSIGGCSDDESDDEDVPEASSDLPEVREVSAPFSLSEWDLPIARPTSRRFSLGESSSSSSSSPSLPRTPSLTDPTSDAWNPPIAQPISHRFSVGESSPSPCTGYSTSLSDFPFITDPSSGESSPIDQSFSADFDGSYEDQADEGKDDESPAAEARRIEFHRRNALLQLTANELRIVN